MKKKNFPLLIKDSSECELDDDSVLKRKFSKKRLNGHNCRELSESLLLELETSAKSAKFSCSTEEDDDFEWSCRSRDNLFMLLRLN